MSQATTEDKSQGFIDSIQSLGERSSTVVCVVDWEIPTAVARGSKLSVCDAVESVIRETNQDSMNGTPKVNCLKLICS